ncbi:MAG: hypothetical protein V9G16_06165 [Nitrosomonas sp.]
MTVPVGRIDNAPNSNYTSVQQVARISLRHPGIDLIQTVKA